MRDIHGDARGDNACARRALFLRHAFAEPGAGLWNTRAWPKTSSKGRMIVVFPEFDGPTRSGTLRVFAGPCTMMSLKATARRLWLREAAFPSKNSCGGTRKAQECPRLRSLTSKARALAALDGARAKCAPWVPRLATHRVRTYVCTPVLGHAAVAASVSVWAGRVCKPADDVPVSLAFGCCCCFCLSPGAGLGDHPFQSVALLGHPLLHLDCPAGLRAAQGPTALALNWPGTTRNIGQRRIGNAL